MSQIAACAHAVGAQPIDTAYADFADEAGYREAALQAKLLGFTGKWCIHPNEIAWANDVFSPTAEEVAAARRVLDVYREAGVGAVALDGAMIDEASRKMAERTLARAQTSTSSK
jgi:citrate lyase subunit beta/citryl-CoA lyase